MGNPAYVGVLARDGRVHYISVQHGGYPEQTGVLLVRHYSTYALARALIMQGECRVIGPTLAECQPYKDGRRREITNAEGLRNMVWHGDFDTRVNTVYMFWPLDLGVEGIEMEGGAEPPVDVDFDDGVEPDPERAYMGGTWECVSRDFITLHE